MSDGIDATRMEHHIRPEGPGDRDAVRIVNESAFQTTTEADLVDTLRHASTSLISLVADVDGDIVGHILFSPVSHAVRSDVRLAGLGPMAVRPDYQKCGVGSALVFAGLDACRRYGYDGVIVLGHPEYYPRFGFVPASRFGICSEFEVPDEVFMCIELRSGAFMSIAGRVRYHEAFAAT